MCWYCIRLDIYSILVLAYCFANKSFTEHHRTLSKWWATEETPTLEALDCSFPCFLCYTLVCKPWRFHFLHGWSLIYGIFFVNTPQKKAHLQCRCAFFNEINPLRDLWNALRAWNTLRVWNALRRVRGFISFRIATAGGNISQFPQGNYFTFGNTEYFTCNPPDFMIY